MVNLAFTYAPKIEGVRTGKIRQTIRFGRKILVGEELLLFAWSGKPYRSKWAWKRPEVCTESIPVKVSRYGLRFIGELSTLYLWDSPVCDELARRDGIRPATGVELGRVLTTSHGVPAEGLEARIVRW